MSPVQDQAIKGRVSFCQLADRRLQGSAVPHENDKKVEPQGFLA